MLKAFLLIVVGLSGDPEHGKTFQKWGSTLAEASGRLGVPPERLVYLVDQPGPDIKGVTGAPTREELTRAFDKFAKEAGPDDLVFVMLIGHGSFNGGTAKFNLPGPDLSGAEFNAMLQKLPTKQLVFVNASASSGPFVEALSAPGRTIITATRNGAEQYATLFGGYFVDALTSDAADADKNKRVSVLEAFNFAKAEVARAYEKQGLLSTEHALLDDNGDGVGHEEAKEGDGAIAKTTYLDSKTVEQAGADAALARLLEERQRIEQEIEKLKSRKDQMKLEEYEDQLEKLLVDLAKVSQDIKSRQKK